MSEKTIKGGYEQEVLPGFVSFDVLSEDQKKSLDDKVEKIDIEKGGAVLNPGLFDLLALASFGSESRCKIIMVVIRLTWLSHAKRAMITNEDFTIRTGMSPGQVSKTLMSLMQSNIIICHNPIQTRKREYSFNKYWNEWNPINRQAWNDTKIIRKYKKKAKKAAKDAETVKINRHLKKLLAIEFHNGAVTNSEIAIRAETIVNKESISDTARLLGMEKNAGKATISRKDLVIIIDYIYRLVKSNKVNEKAIIKNILSMIIKEIYYKRRDYKIDSILDSVVNDVIGVFAAIPGVDCYREIFDPERDIELWATICRNPRYRDVDKVSLMESIDRKIKDGSSKKKSNVRLMSRNWCETSIKLGSNLKNVSSDGKPKDYGDPKNNKRRYSVHKRS